MPSIALRLLSLIPLSKPHQPCTVIFVFRYFYVRYVPGMYQVSDIYTALFPRVRLVCCFPCAYFERMREPSRPLRGLRWPEGNERFRGVSGA